MWNAHSDYTLSKNGAQVLSDSRAGILTSAAPMHKAEPGALSTCMVMGPRLDLTLLQMSAQ